MIQDGQQPGHDDSDANAEAIAELSRTLSAAAAGDETAWRQIVDLYARRVFALAKSRLRQTDLAEDVTQSVFCTVAAKLGTGGYTEKGRFESWLFRVAINRIRDEVRRMKRHAEPTDPEAFGSVEGNPGERARAEEREEDRAMMPKLREAMTALSDADREVVELRHHGGLSFNQISQLLDEPLGTLLARHHRALRKLKELIEGQSRSLASSPEGSPA